MNKTAVVAGVIIFSIVYLLTGFVNGLNDEVDVSYGFHEKELIAGDKVINSTLSLEENKKIWNSSPLKIEMLTLFPRFEEMKEFVNNNIEDDTFKNRLLTHIDDVQEKYIGGTLTQESAKASLSKF